MNPLHCIVVLACCLYISGNAQTYTSYFLGNSADTITSAKGGLCMMGGASEDDQAMTWFLQQANGGDVLVLRASGSDGYNAYMYSELNVDINSVETIVFHSPTASFDTAIQQKIQRAEAIWIAGGDQWDYISYWRNTPIDSLINQGIRQRKVALGGTSAGMAIFGKYYFSAQNGTVSSSEALADPFVQTLTIDSQRFISPPFVSNVITDTHFDNPDRKGRLLVFLARVLADFGVEARAIACDEYTAVCVDTNGIATAFGGYPTYDDNAYFIQVNCALSDPSPENISAGLPLEWNHNAEAINVYRVKGTPSGSSTFDLNDWRSGTDGTWEHWYVDNGVLMETAGFQPDCEILSVENNEVKDLFKIYDNALQNSFTLEVNDAQYHPIALRILDTMGKLHTSISLKEKMSQVQVSTLGIPHGVYIIEIEGHDYRTFQKKWIVK